MFSGKTLPALSSKVLFIAMTFGVMVATAILTYFYVGKRDISSSITPQPVQAEALPIDLQKPPEDLKTLTVLLLGYGGRGHQGGFLTDVIQLVHVDFTQKIVSIISIPRDLWVTLPGGKQAKVNTAFTLGEDPNQPIESGGQVAKQMMSIVTGLPTQYFIATDFVAFKRIIGYGLKGIEVEVSETLDDPWYPITGKEQDICGKTPEEVAELSATLSGFELEKQFECRYERVHFEPGVHEMQGEDALKFVRSRHGSGSGDFSRSKRQHELLNAIKKKLLSLDALSNVGQYYADLSAHTTTDISLEIAEYAAPALKLTDGFTYKTVVLSTDNVLSTSKSSSGQFILVPKSGQDAWTDVQSFIKQEISTK